jgi:hypothetical protein
VNTDVESNFDVIFSVTPRKHNISVYVNAKNDKLYGILRPLNVVMTSLGFANTVTLQLNTPAPVNGCAVNVLSPICDVFVVSKGKERGES